MRHRLLLLPLLAIALALPALAQQRAVRGYEADNACGLIYTDHYGPFDYRNQRSSIKVVEDFHYTARVAAAIGGSTGDFGGDINYTLRASPNHHRALLSLLSWVKRVKSDQTKGMDFPVECYFDRALRFRPDDTVVRAIYARWLNERQRPQEGIAQLDAATNYAGDNPLSHYNLGLIYLELGVGDKALVQAHKARALGHPGTGLEESLRKAGLWQEPSAAAAAASAASAASSPERPAPAASAASAP